jgi:MinD-like ATPase involved in chromosome partitioning or flagellar assembly
LHAEHPPSWAIVVLLEDDDDAEAVARMLSDLAAQGSTVVAPRPPVRGIRFFSDGEAQPRLDAWWELEVPRNAEVIFVMSDADGLGEWLAGIDGASYVGVPSQDRLANYEHQVAVHAFSARSPLDYAAAVMTDLVDAGVYAEVEVSRVRSLAAAFTERDVPDMNRVLGIDAPIDDPGPDPFDLLIAMSLERGRAPQPSFGTAPKVSGDEPAVIRGFRLPSWARRARTWRAALDIPSDDLGSLLVMRGSTIVVVGSRKGGVGKTSHAAGVAIVAGAALDAVGRCAAIVDANLANPDAWGQLNLPPGAATVRDMVVALTADRETPRPVHASTPALACFPEARETTEYSRTEIGLIAAHLRSRYPLVVVDMSNRLPDPTGGPAAAAAAYWLEHADVLVLPTAASKQDFNGVLDYLDVRDLPPVIVASLVPRTRRNREHPLTKRYLTAIAQRVYRVVDVPDDAERVRYAGMQGVPVEAVSPSLRSAYRELADAIVQAPQAIRT